jgi:hypothetical protein
MVNSYQDKEIIIEKIRYEKEIGTLFYDVKNISNWELENLWRLLKAEESRARIVNGFNRGTPRLLVALEKLTKQCEWRIKPQESPIKSIEEIIEQGRKIPILKKTVNCHRCGTTHQSDGNHMC